MLTLTPDAGPSILDSDAVVGSARQQIRVLVVDDHPAVRLGLLRLLEDEPDFEVVAVCATAESAVAQAQAMPVDVAVVDHHLGGRDGLWVSRRLKRLPQPPLVIIYSAYASDHLAANSIVAEADAVLSKGGLGSELCDAIRSLARGGRMPPRVPQTMSELLRRRLDETEQPLFGMMLAGIPRVEIEQTLGISERELSARETSMLRKLAALPGERVDPRRGQGRSDIKQAAAPLPPTPMLGARPTTRD